MGSPQAIYLLVCVGLLIRGSIASSLAQEQAPMTNLEISRESGQTFPEFQQLHEALAELVKTNIPAEHRDERQWNQKKRLYAGVRLRRDEGGGKLETERRWKEVNHGTWKRSLVKLVDPNERLQVIAQPLVLNDHHRYQFDLALLADVTLWGQVAQWNYGVQLFSVSVDGHASLRLQLKGTVGFQLAGESAIPDVIVDPHVDSATIQIDNFNIHRVSDMGGEVAQQVGRLIRKNLDEQMLAVQQERLVQKLNQGIEKKRERLRISPSKWLEQWLLRENL